MGHIMELPTREPQIIAAIPHPAGGRLVINLAEVVAINHRKGMYEVGTEDWVAQVHLRGNGDASKIIYIGAHVEGDATYEAVVTVQGLLMNPTGYVG